VTPSGAPTVETIRFPVRGMTCGSCVNRIMRSVGRVPGVAKVSVDLRHETATVRREPGLVTDGQLAAAVAAAGYEADLASAEVLPPGSDRSVLERIRAALTKS
jgi:Cu+-exporting ATPase